MPTRPYMLQVAPIKAERQIPMSEDQQRLFGIDKLNVPRSDIPARYPTSITRRGCRRCAGKITLATTT